jgi:hypothetical protein
MARVEHQVGVVGDINRIYRAMSEPEGLDGWWATRTDGSPEVGQILNLHFSDVVSLSFRIEALEQDIRVHLHCVSGPGPWQDCDLTFSFKQTPIKSGFTCYTKMKACRMMHSCISAPNGLVIC